MSESRIRLTAQRRAVLEVVERSHDHPTANEIFQRVQSLHAGIAYGTVYTALKALVNEGLVRELKFGDAASRYDGRTEEHHHILCLDCGALAEVEVQLTPAQLAEAAAQTGYVVKQHHIQFSGYCPACQAKRRV